MSLEEFLDVSFDYVIIGGGTAGLVLASRLTEDPTITVGILEAGTLHLGDLNVESIGGNGQMLHNPEYDWIFKTVPQAHNANKVHHIARGKLLGGSSALNFMSYVRPSAEDIDSWSNQAEGWSWKALEPYFRKCESLLPATVTNSGPEYFPRESRLHGDAGPVQLSWPASTSNIDQYVVKAMSNLSVPCLNKDPYGGHHLGFAQYFSTIDRRGGQVSRSYAATGYLRPCLDRPNLRILTEAFACQILLDTPGFRARGVKFVYKGHEHRVFAKREVILSASTIQSPRLLELSGIGNPEVLEAAGLPCLVALPEVGENLQEHPLSVVTYELTESPEHVTLDSLFTNPDVLQVHLKRLQENQDGLLSGVWGLIGFLPYASHVSEARLESTIATISASAEDTMKPYRHEKRERLCQLLRNPQAPTIEMIGMPSNFDVASGYNNQSRVLHGPPNGSNDCYSLLVSPLYTMSHGSTHIVAEGDLRMDMPRIDLALFSHPAEVDMLAAGITTADRAFRSSPLAEQTVRRVMPPPEVDLEDVTQARKYVRENAMIFNHNQGTCAMGRVVDERLCVKGVTGLRVVDCSVFPDQISANSIATVYALAERAADLIKEDGHRLVAKCDKD